MQYPQLPPIATHPVRSGRDVWQRFLQAGNTRPAPALDPLHWRRGRHYYLCWALEVDDAAVVARWRYGQTLLADLLRPDYRRQPHITLAACGFWQPGAVRWNDDCTAAVLRRQRQALASLQSGSVCLQVGGLSSFPSAAFLTLTDPDGALSELRGALLGTATDFRTEPWCPHLTLGLYRHYRRTSLVAARGRELLDLPSLPLRLWTLSLLVYDARDTAGPLRCVRRLPLSAAAATDGPAAVI